MGTPLCVIDCMSLAAFNICPLCFIFVNLINVCLGVFWLGFIPFGTLWISWTWVIISFLPHFREVFDYYLLKYFLMVFLFVSICVKYLFPDLHFQSVCVPCFEVGRL